jgi:tetratricopeptide (TPR) repeat protein
MSETEFVALCLETLGQGAVQSYIDLVYIAAEGSLTLAQLRAIRDFLLAAEQGRRRGDALAVSTAFIGLSEMFKSLGRMRMGLFFMDRLLEVAKLTNDVKSEMRAHHELGSAEEELGHDESALVHHHSHRELATTAGVEEEKALACRHLARVYARQAKLQEKKKEHSKALELFLASLEAADCTNDDVVQADASYAAGRSYVINGQAEAAVPLFQQYVSFDRSCVLQFLASCCLLYFSCLVFCLFASLLIYSCVFVSQARRCTKGN